jgi:hypothetical protein
MSKDTVDSILQKLVREAELAGKGNVYAGDSLPLYVSDTKQALDSHYRNKYLGLLPETKSRAFNPNSSNIEIERFKAAEELGYNQAISDAKEAFKK